ncbi:MAG: peptide deformylase [Pseudomonadota bacterium]
MPVQPILRMGDPRLYQPNHDIHLKDIGSEDVDNLIRDMLHTMESANGAGLAAPQIGINKRLVVFGFNKNSRYPKAGAVPKTVLINPIITPLSGEKSEDWEGCLSVPGMRGKVPRYQLIRYSGYNEKGEKLEMEASGFHARVVQHEVDHLDGILYPQRIEKFQFFGFIEELEHFNNVKGVNNGNSN